MKTQAFAVAMAGWLVVAPTFADHDEHQEAPPAHGGAKAAAADPCTSDEASVDRMLNSLPTQIEAIRNTQDPQERQRLLHDHLVTMDEILTLMERSQGRKRMGHGMMGDDDERPMRHRMLGEDDDDDRGMGRGMMKDEDRGRRMRRGMMEDDGGRRMGRGMGMMGGGMGMMAMHRSVEQRLDRLQKLLQQLIEHELAEKGGNE